MMRGILICLPKMEEGLVKAFLKISLVCIFAFCSHAVFAQGAEKTVAIAQFIEHPALDEVRKAIEEKLASYRKDTKISLKVFHYNAQGNITTTSQIALQIAAISSDVVIAIGTPQAQSLAKALKGKKIPLVFAAITDPVAAGLLEKEAPHPLITGVTDTPPVKDHLGLIRKLVPSLKTLGIVYNPGEANSVATLVRLKEEAQDLSILEIPVTKSSELLTTIKTMLAKVDGLYVPQDNIVVAAMTQVAALATSHQIPIFAADTGSVRSGGALATKSFSYSDIGALAGDKAVQILKGISAGDLAVESPATGQIMINKETASKLKLSLSDELLKEAVLVPEIEKNGN